MVRAMLLRFGHGAALVAIFCATGCGIVDWIVGNNANINGAKPVLSEERAKVGHSTLKYALFGEENHFDKVDLVTELAGAPICDPEKEPQCLAIAFQCFYSSPPCSIAGSPSTTALNLKLSTDLKRRRNAVQERLIAASNSACREFTQHLNSYYSYTNLFLGTAAVGTGAAGAIVGTAAAAQALSGVTGALAGTRAEFNSDIFQKEVAWTITQGIDESRNDYLTELRGEAVMRPSPAASPSPTAGPTGGAIPAAGAEPVAGKKPTGGAVGAGPTVSASPEAGATPPPGYQPRLGRQSLPIDDYPVEAAVADALYYNDLCSLDKGLAKLNKSLVQSENPGLDELQKVAEQVKKYNDTVNPPSANPASPPSDGVSPTPSDAAPKGGKKATKP